MISAILGATLFSIGILTAMIALIHSVFGRWRECQAMAVLSVAFCCCAAIPICIR